MSGIALSPAAWFFALCAVVLVIGWGMLSPVERLPLWSRTHDKLMHGAAFALLAVLASLSLPQAHALTLWVALVVAGIGGEVAQHLSPHRQFCWRDAAANAVGAAVGLGGYQWIIDPAL